jgi:phosphoketolase
MHHNAYLKILATHGRRVANRVVLAEINEKNGHKELRDFFACYGAEDDLPENEKCKTELITEFDPTGWFDHYASPIVSMWPEPVEVPPT